jgi:hypothetical protein
LLKVDLIFFAQAFMAIDLLLQDAQPVPRHDDLVKENIDGDLFWLDGLVGGLQNQRSAAPFVTNWNDLGNPAPEAQDFEQRLFGIGMGFDFFRDVFGNDLLQVGIALVDLFDSVLDNRAQRRLRTRSQQCWDRSSAIW